MAARILRNMGGVAIATETQHSTPANVDYSGLTLHITPEVGDVVIIDGKTISERLLPGDPEPFGDGWPGCDFRYPLHACDIAVNIHVTGRTVQFNKNGNYGGWVRVKVEWVGDCEPSTFTGGWLRVDEYEND